MEDNKTAFNEDEAALASALKEDVEIKEQAVQNAFETAERTSSKKDDECGNSHQHVVKSKFEVCTKTPVTEGLERLQHVDNVNSPEDRHVSKDHVEITENKSSDVDSQACASSVIDKELVQVKVVESDTNEEGQSVDSGLEIQEQAVQNAFETVERTSSNKDDECGNSHQHVVKSEFKVCTKTPVTEGLERLQHADNVNSPEDRHISKDHVEITENKSSDVDSQACASSVIDKDLVQVEVVESDTNEEEQSVVSGLSENHVEDAAITGPSENLPVEKHDPDAMSSDEAIKTKDESDRNENECVEDEISRKQNVAEKVTEGNDNVDIAETRPADSQIISSGQSDQSGAEFPSGSGASQGPQRTHILAESLSMTDLILPIKTSARIKYASLAVSSQYIALGASTGCIYIFNKDSLKYLQLIPSEVKDGGAVVKLAFGPDDHILGVGTSKGHVVVLELQLEKRTNAQKLRSSKDHLGSMITELCWSGEGNKLYVGDDKGKVTLLNVASSMAKGLLSIGSELVMKLDSPVVQIDVCDDKILISACNRTYLGFTNIQKFQVVGTKLRDGRYGACFYHMTGVVPVIYCARPGSRMWEVDHDGNVLNTHQFKQLLDIPAVPVVNLIDSDDEFSFDAETLPGPQSMAFPKLLHVGEKFLLTINERGLFIFNPAEVKVVLWTDQLKDALEVVCVKNDVYILNFSNGIQKLTIHSIPKLVSHVYSLGHWTLSSKILLAFQTDILRLRFLKYISSEIVSDLEAKLPPEEVHLRDGLANFLIQLSDKIESYRKSKKSADSSSQDSDSIAGGFCRNEQGIYVREERSVSMGSDDMALANEALLDRVIAAKTNRAEDAKSLDSISTTSSTESEQTKTPGVTTQAKLKLLSFTDKIKKLAKSASSQDIAKAVKSPLSSDDSKSSSADAVNKDEELGTSPEGDANSKNEIPMDSKFTSSTLQQSSLANASESSANQVEAGLPANQADVGLRTNQEQDTTSDSLSLSSSELVFGPTTTGPPDPEPRYAKPSVLQKGKGKKKKAKLIDLDGDKLESGLGGRRIRRSTSAVEKKSHSGFKFQQRSRSFVDSSRITEINENTSIDECPNRQDLEDGTQTSLKVDPDIEINSNGLVRSEESTPRSQTPVGVPPGSSPGSSSLSSTVEVEKSESDGAVEESAKTSSTSGSPPSPKNTLSAVRDKISAKMQTTAISFMQTIKETGQKLGKKNAEMLEIPPMAVTTDVNVTDRKIIQPEIEACNPPREEEELCTVPLDLTDLMARTKITIEETEKDEIVNNPSACKSALRDWLRQLHTVTRQVHKNKVLTLVQKALDEQNANKPEPEMANLRESGEKATVINVEGTETCSDSNTNVYSALTDQSETETGDKVESRISEKDPEEGDIREDIDSVVFDSEKDFIKENVCEILSKSSMLCPEFDNPAYIYDPFSVEMAKYPRFMDDVEKLATMCFELGAHGDISRYMDPFTNPSESSKPIIQKRDQEQSESMSTDEKHAEQSSKLSEYDLEETCKFLRCCFYCLDSKRIHQAILRAEKEQRPKKWKVYMELCDEVASGETALLDHLSNDETNEVYDRLRSGVMEDKRSTPALIKRLFSISPSKTLKFCAEMIMSKWMVPLDVLYMCAERKDAAKLFVYYYKVFSEARSSFEKEDILQEFCQDTEVYHSLLECLLQTGKPTSPMSCHCGCPLPRSHHLDWKESDLIDSVLQLQIHHDQDQRKDLVYLYGYWAGFLQLIQGKQHDEHVMKLIVQLDDKDFLKQEITKGCFAQSLEEWKMLFRMKSLQEGVALKTSRSYHKYGDLVCLNCGAKIMNSKSACGLTTGSEFKDVLKSDWSENGGTDLDRLHGDSQRTDSGSDWSSEITWEYLASLLVETVGSSKGLQVLKEIKIPNGALSFAFYQGLMVCRVTEKQQSLLVHNMLERLSSYLWSRRPVQLPPKVIEAVNKEKKVLEGHALTEENVDNILTLLAGDSPKLTLKEPEAHWGSKFNLSEACPKCSVPMSKPVPLSESGLVFFPCGHGYHKLCNSSGLCLKCSHR